MIKLKGKTINNGLCFGKVSIYKKTQRNYETVDYKKFFSEEELNKFAKAVDTVRTELKTLTEKAILDSNQDLAKILTAQEMILQDEEYLHRINDLIVTDKKSAGVAIDMATKEYLQIFDKLEDNILRERAEDLKEIETLLQDELSEENKIFSIDTPCILLAEELSASELARLDKNMILGIALQKGSIYSHSAILIRMMNIPAVCGIAFDDQKIEEGAMAIIDANNSELQLEVNAADIEAAKDKINTSVSKNKRILRKNSNMEININISDISEIADEYIENDIGVGLYRSEVFYLQSDRLPNEEQLYELYKKMAIKCKDKKLVIRTIDFGSDKKPEYLTFDDEKNPALGLRGIRVALSEKEIFMTQLKAVLRAGVYGNIELLYPMIVDCEEVLELKDLVNKAADILETEGKQYKIPKQGIMIETPSAVMLSDELAKLVDFFSIGTNDLTQYTLCIDRENEKLAKQYNYFSPAIRLMLEKTIASAHKQGIPCGICGELAADTTYTQELLQMGIDNLSIAPTRLMDILDTL